MKNEIGPQKYMMWGSLYVSEGARVGQTYYYSNLSNISSKRICCEECQLNRKIAKSDSQDKELLNYMFKARLLAILKEELKEKQESWIEKRIITPASWYTTGQRKKQRKGKKWKI